MDRVVLRAGVVVGDQHDEDHHDQPDGGRDEDAEVAVHEVVVEEVETDHPHRGRGREALVEGPHDRAAGPHPHEERADDGRDDRPGADEQREQDRVGEEREEGRIDARGPDEVGEEHRGERGHDIRLEQVRGHSGAVPDVVAHVVGDDPRVPGVVFGDPRFDLPDEVGPDVRTLGVDAAADPREEAHQGGAEKHPDHLEDVPVERPVESDQLEERQARDREPGDASAPEGERHGVPEAALPRVRGRPDVGPDADEHADGARERAARHAKDEADGEAPAVAGDPEGEGDDHGEGDRDRKDDQGTPAEGTRPRPPGSPRRSRASVHRPRPRGGRARSGSLRRRVRAGRRPGSAAPFVPWKGSSCTLERLARLTRIAN